MLQLSYQQNLSRYPRGKEQVRGLHQDSSGQLGTYHRQQSQTHKWAQRKLLASLWGRNDLHHNHRQVRPNLPCSTFLEGTRRTHPQNRVLSLNCRCRRGRESLHSILNWTERGSRSQLGTQQGARQGWSCCRLSRGRSCQRGTQCNYLVQCWVDNSQQRSLEVPDQGHYSSSQRNRTHLSNPWSAPQPLYHRGT